MATMAATDQGLTNPPSAPALWNPSVAAAWSILFTPIFGAYLHMLNWRALNEPIKAANAKGWLIASLIVLGVAIENGFIFSHSKPITRLTGALQWAFLIFWYFLAARTQAKYVKEHFGKAYPHKRWGKPLMMGALGIVVLVVGSAIAGAILGISDAGWSWLTEMKH
jgi:hypothetical protein